MYFNLSEIGSCQVNVNATLIHEEMKNLLDKHAPMKIRTQRLGSKDKSCLIPDALKAKRKSRRLERHYRKYGVKTDRIAYRQARRHACDKIKCACTDSVRQKI